jgi:hypothetical protein
MVVLVNCWPTPTDDGSCDVNIEYELENDKLALYDLLISIPLPYVLGRLHLATFTHTYSDLAERQTLQPLMEIGLSTRRPIR